MSKIGLIIEREYLTRVQKKTFILMTILVPFIVVAIGAVPAILAQIKDSDLKEVALIDRTGKYSDIIQDIESYKIIRVEYSGDNAHDYFSKEGKGLHAIIEINEDLIKNPSGITIYSDKTVNLGLKNGVASQLDSYLTSQKIESYDIPGLRDIITDSKVKLDIQTMKWSQDGEENESSSEIASIIGIVFTFLIYMFVFAYGSMVMQGVLQEKTNRIMEVMVSSVKPFELMMGKIIAVAMVGITQFMIWGILIFGITTMLGLGAAASMGSGDLAEQMTNMQNMGMQADPSMLDKINGMLASINFPQLILCFLIYFIGGYLLYASIFAAIGSVVDQEADTQQFMIPITMVIMFGFYAALYSMDNPDGPLAFWCSMIPFTSPVVMMVRIPFDVPFWQLALSISILFATFIGMTYLAAKIYRTGILMYGKKVTWKELAKWLKY